jgi:hypothetical protein
MPNQSDPMRDGDENTAHLWGPLSCHLGYCALIGALILAASAALGCAP